MLCRFVFILLLIISGTARAESDLRIWYTKPAAQWEDGLPIGSGRMGAMVFGGISDERIQFNEDTLWTGKPHDYVRDGAGDALDDIRKLVFAGNEDAAAKLVREKFLSDPVRQKSYQPFGDIHIHFDGQDNSTDYRRELNLEDAVAHVSYRVGEVTYDREVFASYPDNVIAVRLSASKSGSISCTIKMDSPHKTAKTQAAGADTLVMTGQVRDNVPPNDLGMRFE